ncbi:MAG: Hpt domain-containing protein, partial [Campylobacterota bacterium]|nr:Hpt domain-containing protein [Campylobacterota bacterium]
ASQKLKDEKVDKKPTLETLRDEDKELDDTPIAVVQKSTKVHEAIQVADEALHLDELAVEDEVDIEDSVKEEEVATHALEIESMESDTALEDDLKLAGIDLEEKEEDEASIDELLALADEQENAQKEMTPEFKEEEPTLALDEEGPTEELKLDTEEEELSLEALGLDEEETALALDEEESLGELKLESEAQEEELGLGSLALDEEEPALALEEDESTLAFEEETTEEIGDLLLSDEEESKEEASLDEGLLLSDDEEISDLLLGDDEEPLKEETKAEPIEEIGDLLLSDDEEPIREEKKEEIVEEIEEFDDLLMLDDEFKKEAIHEESKVEEEVEEFDDLLMLDDEKPETTPTKETPKEEVDEIKDLLSEIDDEAKSETVPEEPKVVKKPVKSYEYPDTIEIDLDEYGEMIGLGAEDYTEFLNEFIDKSIIYDENLRSEDKDAREEALNELYSISQSLQLPHLDEILEDMLDRDYLEEELVDIYFDCLAKVTTKSKPQEAPKSVDIFEDEPKIEEPKVEEPVAETPVANANGYGTLSFEGIKPIHFDFRLEEAAEDLSLPVDLIEEFVNDFIEQAIEEKETFIKAYAEGDMDSIQKTGHKLKGASSNLRIIPLSETLEEIQHCETPARFEPLLKKYWGQFLSFKLFMENISH